MQDFMIQRQLNNCLLLSINKEKTDNVKLINVVNEFYFGNEECTCAFRYFCIKD